MFHSSSIHLGLLDTYCAKYQGNIGSKTQFLRSRRANLARLFPECLIHQDFTGVQMQIEILLTWVSTVCQALGRQVCVHRLSLSYNFPALPPPRNTALAEAGDKSLGDWSSLHKEALTLPASSSLILAVWSEMKLHSVVEPGAVVCTAIWSPHFVEDVRHQFLLKYWGGEHNFLC